MAGAFPVKVEIDRKLMFVFFLFATQSRGWGVEMNPELFNKQQELWEQVSRRSSLSALSLASSVRYDELFGKASAG